MYSREQDPTAAARTALTATGYQPCAAPRSLQVAARHQPGKQVSPPAAAAVQPRCATKCKKHGASSSSRRSSTTVVATDVSNFRAMVQELTGFPAAAIFRPLPRRVHAASPFAAGAGQGCSGRERHGHRGSEATNNSTAGGAGSSSPDAPAPLPVMAPPPLDGLFFDGLTALGSPEFDTSWGDLSIIE